MKPATVSLALVSLLSANLAVAASPPQKVPPAWRNIETGWIIPDESYADQPYIVKCDDGRIWTTLAFMTHGPSGRWVKHARAADFVWRTAYAATTPTSGAVPEVFPPPR